eukprot:GHVL01004634.1.p1 GENE.GHVL01004634.1~~GHVL01004634.1.p1  ORF type:complete len:222 (+),score=51.10 GHVL01004634.1:46-711(+)
MDDCSTTCDPMPVYAASQDECGSIDESDDSNEEQEDCESRHHSIEEALDKKEEGNLLYKDKKYLEAIECYTFAINLCPIDNKEQKAVFYTNRATAHYMIESWDQAINDSTKALKFNKNYVKALNRRYMANNKADKKQAALDDLRLLVELDPSLKLSKEKELVTLEREAAQKFENDKEEMMDKLKGMGNFLLGKVGLSLDNFKVQQNSGSGTYNISFQQNSE